MAVRAELYAKAVSAGGTVINYFKSEQSAHKTTDYVLGAEYKVIWSEDPPKEKFEENYRKNVQAKNQAALCLSGGGIRSGAFSLGVLQVLARHGLLTQFQ